MSTATEVMNANLETFGTVLQTQLVALKAASATVAGAAVLGDVSAIPAALNAVVTALSAAAQAAVILPATRPRD